MLPHQLELLAPARTFDIGILLTGDGNVRSLNRRYRGQDKPTNVLAFPAIEDEAAMREMRETHFVENRKYKAGRIDAADIWWGYPVRF